jgi:hypothetical protein
LCDQCDSYAGFYESADASGSGGQLKCSECYKSCQSCTGGTSNDCLTCKSGWKFDEESKTCQDLNECLMEKTCKENEYCENTDGSFVCYECDPACASCTAKGQESCLECNRGYRDVKSLLSSSLNCQDINECDENPNICGQQQQCINKPGSFECKGI